jgi:hypothetical protein
MDLAPFVEALNRAVAAAGTASGKEAEAFLDRFAVPLESAVRLSMLNALFAAADEISEALGAGAIHVRLKDGNPSFVVTSAERPAEPDEPAAPPPVPEDDGPTSRISLRLPESLKTRVDDAASRDGLSVNAWLIRVLAATVDGRAEQSRRGGLHVGQSYVGWTR